MSYTQTRHITITIRHHNQERHIHIPTHRTATSPRRIRPVYHSMLTHTIITIITIKIVYVQIRMRKTKVTLLMTMTAVINI